MMRSIFNEGKKQEIVDVLKAKDERVVIQQDILKKYPKKTLVDINLNIPGMIKNNQYLNKIFMRGIYELEQKFKIANYDFKLIKHYNLPTGSENFYILNANEKNVKKITIEFENKSKLGRLFDADVLVKDKKDALSRKNLGMPARKCFLCERPAKECARSRRHSVAELQNYISKLYWTWIK